MMNKSEIKVLRDFLAKTKMTQVEFSKEAGISDRTLRKALKTGQVSDKTYGKILDVMLEETRQRFIIKPVIERGIEESIALRAYNIALTLCASLAVFLGFILFLYWITK